MAQLSDLQQRALLDILPLTPTQGSCWDLPRKDSPDYATQFQSQIPLSCWGGIQI